MHQALTLSKNFNCSSINTIWYASQPEIDLTALSLPFLQHELILNLGDTFNVSYAHTNQETLFSPILAKAITTEVSGKYQAMGVLFPPVGIYEMYGISVAELKTSEEQPEAMTIDYNKLSLEELVVETNKVLSITKIADQIYLHL